MHISKIKMSVYLTMEFTSTFYKHWTLYITHICVIEFKHFQTSISIYTVGININMFIHNTLWILTTFGLKLRPVFVQLVFELPMIISLDCFQIEPPHLIDWSFGCLAKEWSVFWNALIFLATLYIFIVFSILKRAYLGTTSWSNQKLYNSHCRYH